VKDIDGNIFLDFSSGIAVTNVGHKHPKIVEAVKRQSDELIFINSCDFYTLPQVELAERLCEVTPGEFKKRVFFGNSGTEAVEAALKIAQWHTRNYYVIGFIGGFHGRTMGSLQLTTTSIAARRHYKGMMQGVFHVPYAYCYRCPFKLEHPDCGLWCVGYIEEIMLKKVIPPDDVACMVVEPIQGAAGYIVPPRGVPASARQTLQGSRDNLRGRRGADRFLPHGEVVRLRALGGRAGHRDPFKGHCSRPSLRCGGSPQ
jgi:4-aminobutyrate aminotransferase